MHGNGSYAFGNDIKILSGADNTFVLGNNVTTGAKNAVILGAGSEGVDNAVSVGKVGAERRIVNVAAGTADSDTATFKQVKDYSKVTVNGKNINTGNGVNFEAGDNITLETNGNTLKISSAGGDSGVQKEYVDSAVNRLNNKMTKKIDRLGAKSAAIAALHPMDLDEDHQVSASAGVGMYGGEAAAAVGIFYKPKENLMFNVGGAAGRGSVMGNLGVSYRFGGSGSSVRGLTKTAMAQKISTMERSNRSVQSQLRASLNREKNLVKRVAAAEERTAKLEKQLLEVSELLKKLSKETK